MMPPKAVSLRSEQLSLLRIINHKMNTDPEIGRLLHEITGSSQYGALSDVEEPNVQ